MPLEIQKKEIPYNKKTITSYNNINIRFIALFQFTNLQLGCNPFNKKRSMQNMLNAHNLKKWWGLVNVSNKCVCEVLSHMCPGPSQNILQAASKKLIKTSGTDKQPSKDEIDCANIGKALTESMFHMLKNTNNASIVKDRAILGNQIKKDLQKYCKKYSIADLTSRKVVASINDNYTNLMNGNSIRLTLQT